MVKIWVLLTAGLIAACATAPVAQSSSVTAPGSALAADKAAKANGLTIQDGRAVYVTP